MGQRVLKSQRIDLVYLAQQDDMNKKIVLMIEGVLIALLPFLIILPILTFYIWHIDRADPRGEYVRKVDMRRIWTLLFLIPSFFAFYFFVFPLIPPNPLPMWGWYSQIAVQMPMWLSISLFSVVVVATAYLSYRAKIWAENRFNPLLKLVDSDDFLILPTQTHGTIILDKINTGIMVVGSPGGGKTELIKQFMAQMPEDRDYPWIVFDPKGDYIKEFYKEGDIILAIDGGTHAWNIFKEIDIDPENEAETLSKADVEIGEIAAGILDDSAWQQDKFWIQTARQVFKAVVFIKLKEALEMYWLALEDWMHEVERAKEEGREPPPKPEDIKFEDFIPTNYDLADFFRKSTLEELYKYISGEDRFRAIAGYVNPEAEKMAISIHATLMSELEKLFMGSFGSMQSAELPQFSIRDYMQNPNGRKLFIYYDVTKGEVVGNIYKVLIERAIKFALDNELNYTKEGQEALKKKDWQRYNTLLEKLMAQKSKDAKLRRKFFFIDEFQNIPPITNYGMLVNLGRSLGCTTIIGIQSLAQVDEKYKETGTNSIVAGHSIVISFKNYDPRTTKFVMERLGTMTFWVERPIQVSGTTGGSATIGKEVQKIEFSPVEEHALRKMPPGAGILITRHGFKILRIYPYEEAMKYIKKMKDGIWKLRLKKKLEAQVKKKEQEKRERLKKLEEEKRRLLKEVEEEKKKLTKRKHEVEKSFALHKPLKPPKEKKKKTAPAKVGKPASKPKPQPAPAEPPRPRPQRKDEHSAESPETPAPAGDGEHGHH